MLAAGGNAVDAGVASNPALGVLQSDQVNQEMVAAMIKLARTMHFRVVAEQVEMQEDFDWLRDAGIDFVQGNFVDSPVALGTSTTGTYRTLSPGSATRQRHADRVLPVRRRAVRRRR